MANTDTTAINDLLPTVIGEAKDFYNKTGVSKNLVDNYVMTGGTLQIPKWDDTITVYSMTEGVPMGTPQSITTSNATITAAHYGAKTPSTETTLEAVLVGYTTVKAKGPLSEPFVILHPWHMHHLKANLVYPAATYAQPTDALGVDFTLRPEIINGIRF